MDSGSDWDIGLQCSNCSQVFCIHLGNKYPYVSITSSPNLWVNNRVAFLLRTYEKIAASHFFRTTYG